MGLTSPPGDPDSATSLRTTVLGLWFSDFSLGSWNPLQGFWFSDLVGMGVWPRQGSFESFPGGSKMQWSLKTTALEPCYSECGPCTKNIGVTWELARKAYLSLSPAPLKQNLHSPRSPGDFTCTVKFEKHSSRLVRNGDYQLQTYSCPTGELRVTADLSSHPQHHTWLLVGTGSSLPILSLLAQQKCSLGDSKWANTFMFVNKGSEERCRVVKVYVFLKPQFSVSRQKHFQFT